MKKLLYSTAIAIFLSPGLSAQNMPPLANTAWIDTLATGAAPSIDNYTPTISSYQPVYGDSVQYMTIYNLLVPDAGSESNVMLVNNSDGSMAWQENFTISGYGANFGTVCYITHDYAYAAGVAVADAGTNLYLYKLNRSDGSIVWNAIYAGSFTGLEVPTSLIVDESGNIYLGGTVQTGANEYQMTIIKYDGSGDQLWVGDYDTSSYTGVVAMALSGSNLVATGFSATAFNNWAYASVGFNAATGALESASLSPNAGGNFSAPIGIGTDPAGFYISGTATTTTGYTVIKTIFYDTLFSQQWISIWGDSTTGNSAASGLAGDEGGNPIITGYTTASNGAKVTVVLKYNRSDGTLAWANTIPAPNPANDAQGVSITADANSYYVASKVSNGSTNSIVTSAYDYNGNAQWEKTYKRAAETNDEPTVILAIGSPNIITLGTSTATDSLYVAVDYSQFIPTPCNNVAPGPEHVTGLRSECPTITYTFENGQITTSGLDTFVEFDVYALQNTPGTPFSAGNVIFTYSNAIFGTNVVSNSNITVTPGTITSDTSYHILPIDTLYQSDAVQTNDGEVQLSIASSATSGLFTIADTFQRFCHVKMKTVGRGNCSIGFDQFFMENQSLFNPVTYGTAYDYVYAYGSVGTLRSGSINAQLANENYSSGVITFDVQIQSDAPDYFYGASVVISDDTNNFGADVTGNLSCSSSAALSSSLYTLSAPDITTGQFGISIAENSANFDIEYPYDDGSPSIPNPTISGWTTMATCSLTVQNCCYESGNYLAITNVSGTYTDLGENEDDTDMANWYYFLTGPDSYTQGTMGTAYDNGGSSICTSDGINPVVNSFSPPIINAGTFSVLTIQGTGFGCETGQVFFTNAHGGGTSMMHTQVPDIQEWTDNEIQVWVPSVQDGHDPNSAGTGPIEVATHSGYSFTTIASLIIPYGALNIRDANNNPIYVGLANQNGTGGYTFTPDANMSSAAKTVIIQAMNNWICQTGVNFTMGPSATGLVDANDGINAIFFGSLTDIDAGTDIYEDLDHICYENQHGVTDIIDINMVFNNAIQWDDTTIATPAADEESLLAVADHEFGHSCGVTDCLNAYDLMYALDPPVGDSGLSIQLDDQRGALYILTDVGPNQLGGCSISYNQQSYPDGCPTLKENGINSVTSVISFSAFPNPFNDNININASLIDPAQTRIYIFDMLGQKLFSKDYGVLSGNIKEEINLYFISEGVYILRAYINDQNFEVKLIKN